MMAKKLLGIGLSVSLLLTGCAAPMTNTEKGTALGVGLGAATGALLGQAIGRNAASTVMGAAAGAVVGGIAGNMIGNYMDRQEHEFQQALAQQQQWATVQRQQDTLAITMKSDVLFETGSYALQPGAYGEIRRIADILVRYPETRVTIEGHTDSMGSERQNQQLSEMRARAVADALAGYGVHPSRLSTQGFGEMQPIASNATETGRQLNRRVTIVVTPVEA